MEDPGNGAQRGYPVLINRVDVLKALAHYQPFVGRVFPTNSLRDVHNLHRGSRHLVEQASAKCFAS
jgi:hypothetical protein